jgi:hypothetical protein
VKFQTGSVFLATLLGHFGPLQELASASAGAEGDTTAFETAGREKRYFRRPFACERANEHNPRRLHDSTAA